MSELKLQGFNKSVQQHNVVCIVLFCSADWISSFEAFFIVRIFGKLEKHAKSF